MKSLTQSILFTSIIVAGCGNYDRKPGVTELELGDAGEALTSHFSPTYTYGVSSASSHVACKGLAGEVCIVPRKRQFTYCYDPITASRTISQCNLAASRINSAGPGFNFAWTAQPCTNPSTEDFQINDLIPQGAAHGSQIDDYAGQNFTSPQNITSNLPGQYQIQSAHKYLTIVHLDRLDIEAKTTITAERDKLTEHACGHEFMALAGIGGRTDVTNSYSARAIAPIIQTRVPYTGGESCRAASYSTLDPTSYNGAGTSCAGD